MLKRKTETKVKRTNKLIGEGGPEEKIIPAQSHEKTKLTITTLYRTSFLHFYFMSDEKEQRDDAPPFPSSFNLFNLRT